MIDFKTMTAQEMVDDCLADAKKLSPVSPYPYAFGGLSTYVRWLVQERDRMQGVILAYEMRDEKKREDARDMLQEIKVRSASMRGEA